MTQLFDGGTTSSDTAINSWSIEPFFSVFLPHKKYISVYAVEFPVVKILCRPDMLMSEQIPICLACSLSCKLFRTVSRQVEKFLYVHFRRLWLSGSLISSTCVPKTWNVLKTYLKSSHRTLSVPLKALSLYLVSSSCVFCPQTLYFVEIAGK